ncbi:BsuPI-related putative proteinase inhibitor [Bacillus suaedaesalsae]|uniref:Intracellular proteinase inhibitor BsuPI domain-containing protein n=1 Tax=Bacillus suaedaesalsae TaxID=2810349 RepID=A0ABS2DF75_9BACI|nr:BsuPI-related putative proteinase inhibitor [Bacillus suaedaesalsae]MBM6617099.1 hypothetical protein [Bacillus suaedaesalsae]
MKQFILSLGIILVMAGCGTVDQNANGDSDENSKEATTPSIDLADFETTLNVEQTDEKATFSISFSNEGEEDADVMFSSGQKFELVVENENKEEVYRYSIGKMFTMALETIRLAPGEKLELTDEWDYMVNGEKVPPGEYKATVTMIPKEINEKTVDANTFQAETTFTVEKVEGANTSQAEEKENTAFRNINVTGENGEYTITGEARVFEATFFYSVEDGHEVIIPETVVHANEGAPSWSHFELKISIPKNKLPKNGTITAQIYERSANDDSVVNQVHVSLQQFQ